MGGGNPLKKIEKETKQVGRNIGKAVAPMGDIRGWDSNDWMIAGGVALAAATGGASLAATGTLTTAGAVGLTGGAMLASQGVQGRAADKAQEEADRAEQQAMLNARALQDRLEQEDYLMRLQSGVDSKTSKGSKTKYGTGSNVSMTAQDLLIPIVNDTTKKTQPIGLGF